MGRKYITIDLFRILFTVGVIFGHIYCNFYQEEYIMLHNEDWIGIQNMCVDAFFMISGIFMAAYVEKHIGGNPYELFKNYQIGRIKRFFLPVVFTTLLFACIQLKLLGGGYEAIINSISLWPNLFLLCGINGMPGHGSLWYVGALFWMGFIVSALLMFKNKISRYFYFPALTALTFTMMYCIYGNLSLGDQPRIFIFFSAGNLRAVCGLCIGIELFYFSSFFMEHFQIRKRKTSFLFVAGLELLSTMGLLYCMTREGHTRTDFFVYPCWMLLCIIFLTRNEVLYRFVNSKRISVWIEQISSYTFFIYLTHPMLLEKISNTVDITNIPPAYVYVGGVLCSFVFGIMMYYLEKIFEKIVYRGLLFMAQECA